MRLKPISISLLILLFLGSSSYSQKKAEWKGSIEYENGVKIIKNPDDPLYGEIALELAEDLVIGSEGDENYMFFQVTNIAVDLKGNIYVLDGGNCRIQKFDKDGRYLQTIGRKGQGPGEFQVLSSVIVDTNYRIYVNDFDIRTIHVLDRNGEFIHSIKSNDFLVTVGFLDNGNLLAHTIALSPGLFTHAIKVLDTNNEEMKKFKSFPKKTSARIKGVSLSNPYDPGLHFSPSYVGGGVYGFSGEYELYRINSRGDLNSIIKVDRPQIPITRKDKKNLVARYLEGQDQIQRKIKVSRKDVEKAYVFPNYKPYFRYILQDESGRIYVQHFKIFDPNDDSTTYDVFDENGVFFKVVHMPTTPRVIHNGSIYKIGEDPETEYPRIIRYKIKN